MKFRQPMLPWLPVNNNAPSMHELREFIQVFCLDIIEFEW